MHCSSGFPRTALGAALLAALASLAACAERSSSGSTAPPASFEESELSSAPGGVVTTMDGEPFDLAEVYADSPAYVVFYRGHW